MFSILKNNEIDYQTPVSLDGAFYAFHQLYGKHPIFHNTTSEEKTITSYSDAEQPIEPFSIERAKTIDGTKHSTSQESAESLWEQYWYENIEAFRILTESLPQSIVTAYVGRQAIETGFKYLLKKRHAIFHKNHDLGYLADVLFQTYHLFDIPYMEYVDSFCHSYCKNIEGNNPEYFRYPEYKNSKTFAGTDLDIQWLSYNFALILLKLQHLDNETK